MKFKIVKKYHKYNNRTELKFHIMRWAKRWYQLSHQWVKEKEGSYAGPSWVSFHSESDAENWIREKLQQSKYPDEIIDVKVFETREDKLNDLLH